MIDPVEAVHTKLCTCKEPWITVEALVMEVTGVVINHNFRSCKKIGKR